LREIIFCKSFAISKNALIFAAQFNNNVLYTLAKGNFKALFSVKQLKMMPRKKRLKIFSKNDEKSKFKITFATSKFIAHIKTMDAIKSKKKLQKDFEKRKR
jgi:hypothetical protein